MLAFSVTIRLFTLTLAKDKVKERSKESTFSEG